MCWMRKDSEQKLEESKQRKMKKINSLPLKDAVVQFNLEVTQYHEAEEPALSKEERSQVYYSPREIHRFIRYHQQYAKGARKAKQQKGYYSKSEEACLRGLEDCLSIRAALDCKSRKVAVWQAVLDEQRRQDDVGEHKPELIRKASRSASKPSRRRAWILAHKDSEEIKAKPKNNSSATNAAVQQPRMRDSEDRFRLTRQTSHLRIDTASRLFVLEFINTSNSAPNVGAC